MVPKETAEVNVQINEHFQDSHSLQNHKYFMDLPGNYDEEYDSDFSKSSTTSILDLNPTVMPSSATHTIDKVQSVFETLDTRAIQDSDESDSDSLLGKVRVNVCKGTYVTGQFSLQ